MYGLVCLFPRRYKEKAEIIQWNLQIFFSKTIWANFNQTWHKASLGNKIQVYSLKNLRQNNWANFNQTWHNVSTSEFKFLLLEGHPILQGRIREKIEDAYKSHRSWSFESPSPKNARIFWLFCLYLALKNCMALHLRIWIPITQGCFVPSLIEIDTNVSGEDCKTIE